MEKILKDGWTLERETGERIPVSLPHDAMIEEKRRATSRTGKDGGYFPGGIYVYSRELHFTHEDLDKRIELLFEGVYQLATVYLNDQEIARNTYGYGEFTVDLTGKVHEGANILRVKADNSLVPNCRWYSGSGIYRPVRLFVLPKGGPTFLKVRTLSLSPAKIEVTSDEGSQIEIYDGNALLYKGSAGEILISDPHVWSPDTPYLYRAVSKKDGGEKETAFGLRTISYDAKTGFLLNGERTLLRGGCLHHDNGIIGAVSIYDAEYRRIKKLKEEGFNCLRISHNPASRYLLEAADRLGMLILDECFDGWYLPKNYHDHARYFFSDYEKELKAMVEKDYSHPSVIMYSLGNEVTETGTKKGVALLDKMCRYVHSLDDTRPCTVAINVLLDVYFKHGLGIYRDIGKYKPVPLPEKRGYHEKKAGSAFFNYWTCRLGKLMFMMSKSKSAEKIVDAISPAIDIMGLNYASSRYDIDIARQPDRLLLGTETMAGDLYYNWERVKKHPALLGDFVWSAWDYLGEACIGDWTYHSYKGLPLLAGQGMLDITGNAKASMHYMRIVWGFEKNPYLGVRPLNHSGERPSKGAWQFTDAVSSWTWHGYEGKKTVADVFSLAPKVRLVLNGKTIGEKKTKNARASFKLKYEPGILKAVALDESGNETGETTLRTGGQEPVIALLPEYRELKAKEGNLLHLEIEFRDQDGNLLPYIENPVKVEVEGKSLRFLGLGSGLCKTDETFSATTHRAYRGRAEAVFMTTDQEGKSTIKVSSPGLPAKSIEFEVRK